MSANQDCAEQMLIAATKHCLNQTIHFQYPGKVNDSQIDISDALILCPDAQRRLLFSGYEAQALVADLGRLNQKKTYFLRTGKNGGAGHYQLIYFKPEENIWYCYSSENNQFSVTTTGGKLSTEAANRLLSKHAPWGSATGEYSFLIIEASAENLIRAANFIYDVRTQGLEQAQLAAFSTELNFYPQLITASHSPKPNRLPFISSPTIFNSSSQSSAPMIMVKPISQKTVDMSPKIGQKSPIFSNRLSTQHQIAIKDLINKLNNEIYSCWPYPNKDRKQIKVNALNYLANQTALGHNPVDVLNIIREQFPEAYSGHISHRTSSLLDEIESHDKHLSNNPISDIKI